VKKAFEQRRWHVVPKDELDAVLTKDGKPQPVDKESLRQASSNRRIESRRRALRRRLAQ
jgi:hypothetical protein